MRSRRAVLLALALCACDPGPGAAAIDAGDQCDPGCHWSCGGGAQCIDGTAWANGWGEVECCRTTDPWPFDGPVCAASSHACTGGACVAPDVRYAACTSLIGSFALDCSGAACEYLLLLCPEGAAKPAGAPCASDADCRPAADGVARLRCDTAGAGLCVEDARPAPPADYGAGCGLDPGSLTLLDGEAGVTGAQCEVCQVARSAGGCLRQGCTTACAFDEDCPQGSMCLCNGSGAEVAAYCAAATDRDTPAGRAAGLAACR